jgi:hypothetical protein
VAAGGLLGLLYVIEQEKVRSWLILFAELIAKWMW